MTDALDSRLDQVAALGDPVRRALYRFVVRHGEPVTREEAARGVGVALHTAKFHLERLTDDQLLETRSRRPPGGGGPGAGRPAKVYWPRAADLGVSVPERHYDLAGRMLATAIAQSERTTATVRATLRTVARRHGRDAGRARRETRTGDVPTTETLLDALREHGYEPEPDGDDILLRNCPFHALAQDQTELVCGMNLAYLEGIVDGIGHPRFRPRLDPEDGRCCVRISGGADVAPMSPARGQPPIGIELGHSILEAELY